MSANPLDWEMIVEQINDGGCTPVIGNYLAGQVIFGDTNIVEAWAQQTEFPLQERRNLTRVAQYLSFSSSQVGAKRRYLSFLKEQALAQAKARPGANPDHLQQVESQLRGLTFSELVCDHLRYPNFKRDTANPFSILAALNFKLYLTTSPHRLLEAALTAWGKRPHTEVYAWRDDLQDALEEKKLLFDSDASRPVFTPSVAEPLVVHLHGIDDVPSSLVLSEDDYLEALVSITQQLNSKQTRHEVRTAIRNSLLLLIGYRVHAWDLRVLLQGLIRKKSVTTQMRSFAVQLEPQQMGGVLDPTRYQSYLTKYFDKIEFDVYWGNPHGFLQTLWAKMEEG